ncbi:MAG: hypothetical protein SR1Q7_12285 [Quinella sp. 1Q7]|nr:hypothetical protein [Quinella sp. 1Q7]
MTADFIVTSRFESGGTVVASNVLITMTYHPRLNLVKIFCKEALSFDG